MSDAGSYSLIWADDKAKDSFLALGWKIAPERLCPTHEYKEHLLLWDLPGEPKLPERRQ